MPKLKVRGVNLYYELHGTRGPRLLFNAGAGGDLRQRPASWADPLGKHFQVLAYDVRGTGQSDKPDEAYTMEGYAADAAALLDALGWERSLVIGTSFGGGLSHEIALRYPQRVERVAMNASAGLCGLIANGPGVPRPSNWANEFHLSLDERALRIAQLIDTRQNAEWFRTHAAEGQPLIERMKERLVLGRDEPGHDVGYRRQLNTVRADQDTLKRFPPLHMPIGIFLGKYDPLVALQPALDSIKKVLPQAHVETFEGGHGFPAQDPKAWPRIISFLKGEE